MGQNPETLHPKYKHNNNKRERERERERERAREREIEVRDLFHMSRKPYEYPRQISRLKIVSPR